MTAVEFDRVSIVFGDAPDRALPLQTAARILKRTIMAHAVIQPAPDMQILKKNIPSGGGLHPLETYAVVRNVEGLENGIHHYDPICLAYGGEAMGDDDGCPGRDGQRRSGQRTKDQGGKAFHDRIMPSWGPLNKS